MTRIIMIIMPNKWKKFHSQQCIPQKFIVAVPYAHSAIKTTGCDKLQPSAAGQASNSGHMITRWSMVKSLCKCTVHKPSFRIIKHTNYTIGKTLTCIQRRSRFNHIMFIRKLHLLNNTCNIINF